MQNFLQSFTNNSGANGFMSNYINSLGKKPATPTAGPTYAGPVTTTSSPGATNTTPTTNSPARAAYTNSLAPTSSPISTTPPQTTQPITGNTTTPSGAVVNASTGATVSTPAPQNTSYQDAFKAYIQSLTPSDAETSASKNLSALQLQSQKDQEEALNRGDTLGFATGEAARVNHNNSFGIDAASNTLNALTGQRTATTNADKARLDFENSLQTDSKPTQVGNDTYQLNPSTGKYEKISSTPAKLDTSVVDVGGQKVLIDNQTGKTIKNLGSSTDTTGGSTGGLYVQGTNPIADSWIQNINTGKNKITDIKDASLRNLVSQGIAKSASSQNDILTTTVQSLKDLNDMVTNDQGFTGAVGAKGISSFFGLKGSPIAGTAAANFDAKLNQVKNDVILPNLTLLHGLGRVTDREFQALSSAITSLSTNLSEDEFKKELAYITTTINSKAQGASSAPQGGGTSITAPDGQQIIITD